MFAKQTPLLYALAAGPCPAHRLDKRSFICISTEDHNRPTLLTTIINYWYPDGTRYRYDTVVYSGVTHRYTDIVFYDRDTTASFVLNTGNGHQTLLKFDICTKAHRRDGPAVINWLCGTRLLFFERDRCVRRVEHGHVEMITGDGRHLNRPSNVMMGISIDWQFAPYLINKRTKYRSDGPPSIRLY